MIMLFAIGVIGLSLFGMFASSATLGLTRNYMRACLGLALLASTLGAVWVQVVLPMYAVLMLIAIVLYRSAEINKEAMNEEEEPRLGD